jgi:hypothetical protein
VSQGSSPCETSNILKRLALIVVCGPESNGTRLLHRIVSTSGEEVIHRSMPNARFWWSAKDFPNDTIYVISFRDIDIAAQSAVRAGYFDYLYSEDSKMKMALHEQVRARRLLLKELPLGKTYLVTYESLVDNPQNTVSALSAWLGVKLTIPEEIYNANLKYTR